MSCGMVLALPSVLAACDGAPAAPPPPRPAPVARAAPVEVEVAARPPKPGERVRQRELDAYCAEADRPVAFYYHGGRPVERLARKDGCYPLFLKECAGDQDCYAPGDQEPGMWCCHDPSATEQASR